MNWLCDICGRNFTASQGLFLHKRLSHQLTSEEAKRNPLVEVCYCNLCGFKTHYRSSYYRHMRNVHDLEPEP